MAKPDPNAHAPPTNAFTVGLSFFIGLMSLIVAVMAFAVAGRQDNPHAGQELWSNDAAMRLSYAVGILAVVNSFVAFAKARLRPWVTAGCSVLFIITVVLTNALFVRAW